MLQLALTSRYHWSQVGTAYNTAVGDWQVSRVCAALNQPELSVLFARSCLESCRKNRIRGLLPSALEGMARAYAAGGRRAEANRYLKSAKAQLASTTLEAEDRKLYLSQIGDTEDTIGRI